MISVIKINTLSGRRDVHSEHRSEAAAIAAAERAALQCEDGSTLRYDVLVAKHPGRSAVGPRGYVVEYTTRGAT